MSEQQNDELTREERRAFGSLAGAVPASSDLEDRVVTVLHERGLVRKQSWLERTFQSVPRVPRLVVAGLALGATFVVGMEYGKRVDDAQVPEVRLEAEEPAETTKPIEQSGEAVMASVDDTTDSEIRLAVGLAKPDLGTLDEGYGDFPPYPLDGRTRAISPKYR